MRCSLILSVRSPVAVQSGIHRDVERIETKEDGLVKKVLLVVVLMVIITVPSAFAQSGSVAVPEGTTSPLRNESSLYRDDYEVTEKGALIVGGDVKYRCEDLVRFGAPAEPGTDDVTVADGVVEPLTRDAVELCAEGGFPPKGTTLETSTTSSAAGTDGLEQLPGTGGPSFTIVLLGVIALAIASVVASRIQRRS